MAKLRAGLIGLGMMGRHHARVLGSLDGVDLVAVADPGGDAHGVAGGRPVRRRRRGADRRRHRLLHGRGADGVPRGGRAGPGRGRRPRDDREAAGPGHPVRGAAGQGVRRQGLVGAVGHIERYNPALQQARARLEAGELGEVYQVTTRRQGPFPARIADVGVVKDLATHDIDLTAWVTQQTYASVAARTAYKSGREHEDLVAVVGQLADGTVTNHLVNWLSPLKERVTIITGERGTFVADTLTADLTFYANGRSPPPGTTSRTSAGSPRAT